MKFVAQPEHERVCGQTAVAMIAEKTVDEVCAVVGHRHGSKTKELVAALRHFGIKCADRCRDYRQYIESPSLAIAQLHIPGRPGWHWIVTVGVHVYDGNFGIDPPYKNGERITSYLEVYG